LPLRLAASRTRFRIALAVFFLLIALGVVAFFEVGNFLAAEDPLQ
jgi:hypothetical protein